MADLTVTRENHCICKEIGNADNIGTLFFTQKKIDDRLSKDNLKFYEVKFVYGGGQSFEYPKIKLNVGDVVVTEALGVDISYDNVEYKIFDTNYIVMKVN